MRFGTIRSLDGLLAGGPVVLYFYPAAMTTGCTKEGCHFRDLAEEFAKLGAQRVGISARNPAPSGRHLSAATRRLWRCRPRRRERGRLE
ncbi:MAG: redoxin domain-containing protein [Acidimicrobiaceae bacterium]|nr:redoxin domain-containing protein [Acidimicrobiaceae bacterium]